MPIGTLTRKIQCQLSASVRIPPSRTPIVPPPAATNPKTPIAFARSVGSVKRVTMSESATAETIARAETLQRAGSRPACACEVASPQPSDARVKSTIPIRNRRRWPKRSPRPTRQEQEPAEREQIRVRDPGKRALREPEIRADRGQGDPDDRHVEDDHQVAEANDDQREPSVSVGWLVRSSGVLPLSSSHSRVGADHARFDMSSARAAVTDENGAAISNPVGDPGNQKAPGDPPVPSGGSARAGKRLADRLPGRGTVMSKSC